MTSPNFASLSQVEERLLAARLAAVRHAIVHAGEKGRALEHHVRQFLRDMLPQEYGLTTGFVVWISPDGPRLSPQLDIIIYDAIRHSPIVRLETCDVVPLEAAYGYVEVKASLRSTPRTSAAPADDSIEACAQTNRVIRDMRSRCYHIPIGGSPMETETQYRHWLAMRGYVVAFEARGRVGKNAEHFAQAMANALKREEHAHFHGVLVPGHGFFSTQAIDPSMAAEGDKHHVWFTTEHPLLAFKAMLLKGLATFERPPSDWTPAVDLYYSHDPQWRERVPAE